MLFALKIILEIVAVILLLVGYYYEDEVIKFENKLFEELKSQKTQKGKIK